MSNVGQPRTTPMTGPTRKTSEEQLNEFNVLLRSQPWYQEYFASRGLNPNRVKLSRSQQGEIESLMRQNGMPLQGGMHIDQAGNLNQKNRLVRNTAIAAGAVAGAYFGGPALMGMMANGGAPAAVTGAAAKGGALATLGAIAPYAGMGLNFVGNYLNGRAENQRYQDGIEDKEREREWQLGRDQADRDFRSGESQKTRESDQNRLIADYLAGSSKTDVEEQLGRSRMALDSTQMDPFAHARAENAARVRASFGAGVDKNGYFKGTYDLSGLSDANLNKSASNFYDIANEARRGPAGWDDKKAKDRQAILDYLNRYASGAKL